MTHVCQIQLLCGDRASSFGRVDSLNDSAGAPGEITAASETFEPPPALQCHDDVERGKVQLQLILGFLVLQELGHIGHVQRKQL